MQQAKLLDECDIAAPASTTCPHPGCGRRTTVFLSRVRRVGSDSGNGGTGLQQPEGLSRLRRHGGCTRSGRVHSGAGRVAVHRLWGGDPVADLDVVSDEGHCPEDGYVNRCTTLPTDAGGTGYHIPWPAMKRASSISTRPVVRREIWTLPISMPHTR